LLLVDCNTDSVVRLIEVVDEPIVGFEYLGNDRMLSMHYQGLTLIDCKADSIIADSATASSGWCAAAHTGDGEKVYTVRYGHLEARNSSSLSLLDTIYWAPNGVNGLDYLLYSDATNKLYWFSIGEHDSMLVIDAACDTVIARIGTSLATTCACLDATGRYLFCAGSWRDNTLRVYDTRSDSLVAAYPHLPHASSIVSNPDQHCIYVGCQDMILVYPDVPPGVEETPSLGVRMTKSGPTVVRSVLHLPASVVERGTSSVLMDVGGRRVMDLRPGPNDVGTVAPGVYFVREELQAPNHKLQAVRKVVITR
jgi:DNA-binding beta-propeller fold protein YncE